MRTSPRRKNPEPVHFKDSQVEVRGFRYGGEISVLRTTDNRPMLNIVIGDSTYTMSHKGDFITVLPGSNAVMTLKSQTSTTPGNSAIDAEIIYYALTDDF